MRKLLLFLLLAGFAIAYSRYALTTSYSSRPSGTQLAAARQAYMRNKASVMNPVFITLIDYSRPVYATRLWVINQVTGKIVMSSRVSHAWRSGMVFATKMSNAEGSEMSCVGSFVTETSYQGAFGYSLRVRGLDAQNDAARRRNVVFHQKFFPFYSRGCWATAPTTNRRLIGLLRGGSFVFVAR